MANETEKHIFIFDGEQSSTGLFSEILEEPYFKLSYFTRVENCFARLRTQKCDLLIVDLKMYDIDTIALVKDIKRLVPWVAILAIADSGDIPMAIKAIKAGAVDVIEIPLEKNCFLKKIKPILQQNNADFSKFLTLKEMEVLRFILDGKSNKEIAYLLHRSTRTVEVHRKHIMQKLGVDNAVDLIKQAFIMFK